MVKLIRLFQGINMRVLFWSFITVANVFFAYTEALGEYTWVSYSAAILGSVLVTVSLIERRGIK